MLRKLILVAGIAFALVAPAYAANPQTFKSEESATKFCKKPESKSLSPAKKPLSRTNRTPHHRIQLGKSPQVKHTSTPLRN